MKEKVLLCLSLLICAAEITYSQNMPNYDKKRIRPWSENNRYWQYEGKPIILLGASDDDNLFQWPAELLIPHLDNMKKIGANFVRNTMSDRRDKGFEVYPFKETDDGRYDLNQWNEVYWKRFDFFLKESAKRNIIVQIELWDRFDYSRSNWDGNPYNPKNNINYNKEESGLNDAYPDHPGINRQPFFFSPPQQQNNQKLLSIQCSYIEKVLSYTLNHDHILYCIDNETSGEEEWAIFWRDYITDAAHKKGKNICVTEMWDDWNLRSSSHKRTFDHPQRYQFVEISQNTHQNGIKLWDNLRWTANYLGESPRPINIVKTYGSDNGRHGSTKQGIERWWLHLLGGVAAVRFHRPESGLGFSELSVASVKAARKLEKMVNYWDLKTVRQSLHNSAEEVAYMTSNGEDIYLIFLPEGGSTTLLSNMEETKGTVRYLNIRSGEWLHKKAQRMRLSGTTRLSVPDKNEWLIVVTK